jgi:outer membrane protein assembly factor BamE (lipoprotein component of BamABCDE complex)
LFENITNKNEISQILGPPLVKSYFDNNIWIFIERKSSVSSLRYLGKEKLIINDILVLEINNRGILVKKTFHDKESMKKIKMSSETTSTVSVKDSFIQQTLKILERKMNDPLGTKSAK